MAAVAAVVADHLLEIMVMVVKVEAATELLVLMALQQEQQVKPIQVEAAVVLRQTEAQE